MSLPLACRAARSSLLASPTPRVSFAALSIRHASLSAIQRGLVRSEKTRPQGARAGKMSDMSEAGKRLNFAERRKLREELAQQRPTYKIRKGKKDITEYPDKAKPKSRRARFYDPDSPFGKKSLVYQLKTGRLPDELKRLAGDSAQPSSDPFARTGSRPELRPLRSRTARRMARGRGSRREESGDVADLVAELSRPLGAPGREAPRDRGSARDTNVAARDHAARRGESSGSRDRAEGQSPRRDRDAPRRDMGPETRDAPRPARDSYSRDDRGTRDSRLTRDSPRPARDSYKPRDDRGPISVPYTTAASQFLYGKSVVEAALRSSRRQLYKLYVYGGANRQKPSDDAQIMALARRRGVPVTVLDESGLRLMDKMASSRPHNGFVLEASSLPQPPVAALGPLPDDYAARPRYAVRLGHQSAEEAAVNGTPASLPAPAVAALSAASSPHKPLVVVLDQIVDPGNLGAVLRTVSFLGASAVGLTRGGSAGLTPVALKASAGASETLPLFSIPALPDFLNESRANGWVVYAAVAAAGPAGGGGVKQRRHVDVHDVEAADPLRRDPCVLLIGNEGEGLSRLVVKKADYEVNIPNLSGSTAVDSLNVSVAAGLLCSSFLKGMMKELEGFAPAGDGEMVKKETLW